MTTHKPLTEVWFTTQLADYDCNMYGNKKEVFQVFPILSVKSAVQLLKEKMCLTKNRKHKPFIRDCCLNCDLIDEAFPVFKEEDKIEKVN